MTESEEQTEREKITPVQKRAPHFPATRAIEDSLLVHPPALELSELRETTAATGAQKCPDIIGKSIRISLECSSSSSCGLLRALVLQC